MENHLIIGLGGTGGRIIAAYRRIMFEKFKGNMNPTDEGVFVDFVYVDSSETDLNAEGGIWQTLGSSIALNSASKVNIKPANLKEYIENIENYNNLKNWIGTEKQWSHIINDPKLQSGAGGQKRRLGRFLFANKVDDVVRVVQQKVNNLRNKNTGESKLTFHICAGLAGGTGSGSFIDTMVQIRKAYPDYQNNKIILYLLLPEETPQPSWATTGNYKPNGYAALMELNALDKNVFKPWDLSDHSGSTSQLDLTLPFYSAYLITEQNKGNVFFNVANELPAIIAEFLIQKTTLSLSQKASVAGTATDSMLARVESGENPVSDTYPYKHCFKFITFGIKRLAIPEQEIKEYFVDVLANQFVLQAIYNNVNVNGFHEEELPDDNYAEVTKSANTWNLSLPFLTLSKATLEAHKNENWKSINDEFDCISDFCKKIMEDNDII
jgi:hypothetical protein